MATPDYIISEYIRVRDTPSDINEHIETLATLASECSAIAEFGVRTPTSTFAFLHGLSTNKNENKQIVCVDVAPVQGTYRIIQEAKKENIEVTFVQHDSATVIIPFDVDMLFIDTWHVYGHLKRELANSHARVKTYIAMHDTEIDGEIGENIRNKWDVAEYSLKSGYPEEEIRWGLNKAITEFLADHPEWTMHAQYTHNNGLTVLKRVGEFIPQKQPEGAIQAKNLSSIL